MFEPIYSISVLDIALSICLTESEHHHPKLIIKPLWYLLHMHKREQWSSGRLVQGTVSASIFLLTHKFNHMRWPLEYSVYKLYTDMQATKRLKPQCLHTNNRERD